MTVFSPPCAVFSLSATRVGGSESGAAARLRRLRRSSSVAASPQPQLSGVAAPPATGEQRGVGLGVASDFGGRAELKELPLPRGVADDARIHNPLERLERLGTGWMGAVFEWEGVVVDDRSAAHKEAWLALAAELGRSPPPAWQLARLVGMKSGQVVSEVLCWAREPSAVRTLAQRKDALFQASLLGRPRTVLPGARTFLERLQGAGIPAALACSSSPSSLLLDTEAEALGIRHLFDVILGGDDAQRGRPDPELYLYAAQRLQRPPQRSVVIGSGNAAVEAAREGGMRVVAVSGPGSAAYELSAADCVVRQLDALTVSDLKQLFAFESVAEEYEAQTELEEDEEEEDDDAWEGRGGSRGDDRDRMAAFYGSSLY